MKLKQNPDDFYVEELTDVFPGDQGEFALYRLEKTGWATPDALQIVRQRWRIDPRRLEFGGLKDRHAVTSQYFTIYHGPKRNLSHQRLAVTYLGQHPEPFTAATIRANRFRVTLRELSPDRVATAENALREVAEIGFPNYFDDQRFGSVGEGRDFIAREMVQGRFERALWLAIAAPYEFDRAEDKRIKAILRDHWADWPTCRVRLPHGPERNRVQYLLANPTDYRGAVVGWKPELQGLHLAAYQSFLWNRTLGLWLTRHVPEADRGVVELKLDRLPVPRRMPADSRVRWESLVLPLPSARVKLADDDEWSSLVTEVLREEGLTLPELRIKGVHKPFFSKGERGACVRPVGLECMNEADEIHAGRRKLVLSFELPKGSYATMLVKRISG